MLGLGAEAAVHTTLHRWCTGLGRRALDRKAWASTARRSDPKAVTSSRPRRAAQRRHTATRRRSPRPPSPPLPRVPRTPPTTAALVAESDRRWQAGLLTLWQEPRFIPPWKYRSEKRREQLEACARLLAAADRLFPNSGTSLTDWQLWLLPLFGVFAWTFPTGSPCPRMQHPPPPRSPVHSEGRPKSPAGDATHGSRDPPRRDLSL